ncbi:MAG: alpha-L-rhamnosidase C-terminal domain-containing protein [Faecousia sp.]
MCGIRVDGENHFLIAPRPGGHFTYAKASYDSVYGRVESGWRKKEGALVFDITIPANCTAEIVLPNGEAKSVSSGRYCIEIKTN